MTILITGGTGKTGSVLAQRLHAANLSFLIATRGGTSPAPFKAVVFDWDNPATFEAPFKADPNIDRVYLAFQVHSSADNVKAFIDLALTNGVKRFVLLSASQVGCGHNAPMGVVHQYLVDIGVEYAVLRPTWYHQNFGTSVLTGIRDHGQIFTATGNGRVAFVSTEDIADLGFEALTAEPSLNKDILIYGPELLTHDEVAEIFSKVLGRKITHVRLTKGQFIDHFTSFGMPRVTAEALATFEGAIAEDQVDEKPFFSTENTGNKFIGKHTLEQYVLDNRNLWVM